MQEEEDDGLGGAMIGLFVGLVAAIALIITAILCYMKLNKKNKNISEVEAEMKPVDLDKHSEFVKGATVQDNELVM